MSISPPSMPSSPDVFAVVDVETANPDLASICQIGIALFIENTAQDSWKTLVNPEDYFDPVNVSIHGIEETDVKSAPKWPEVYQRTRALLSGRIVVSHTVFDHVALRRACAKYSITLADYEWLDSARVARRAWPVFAHAGYGLSNLAETFSIQYREHDALEDARCAGEILLRAVAETRVSVKDWLHRSKQPIGSSNSGSITRTGSAEGPLHGEVAVFTGALSMLRRDAANTAGSAGCEVDAGVTHRTTLLVVGDQDIRRLAGHEKSAKHRKAEELIKQGQHIRIIGEGDFKHLCGIGTE